MAVIKIRVARGGYTSTGYAAVSIDAPDEIEIEVPVPDRADAYAGSFIRPADYVQMIGATFDKTAELVDAVRGPSDVVDAEISDDEAVRA